MSNTIADYTETSDWWRSMHDRYSKQADPSNHRYGTFNSSGLRMPLVIDSNPQYAVRLRAHNVGPTGPYHMGGVSQRAADHMPHIQKCTDKTGHPSGCASAVLGASTRFAGSQQHRNLGPD